MDTTIIENTQVIVVSGTLMGAGAFASNINIDFIPNMMIVRTIQYSSIAEEKKEYNISSIFSDIVNANIGSFINLTTSNPNTRFLIYDKSIRGTYTFKIIDSGGNIDFDKEGSLYIQLEFVKYKTVKEQKMY